MRAAAACAGLLLLAAAPAAPAQTPVAGPGRDLRPGVGATDRRVPEPIGAMPWHAIVRITTGFGGSCTGVIFAPDRVATAAHCLRQSVTGAWQTPDRIHVLLGYDRGHVDADLAVAAIGVDRGYAPMRARATMGADIAILHLAAPRPAAETLPVATAGPGDHVVLAGFNQDRLQVLLADPDCMIQGQARDEAGNTLFLHDCDATHGTSGAPLLERDALGAWHVVAMEVAARSGGAGGIALPATAYAGAELSAIQPRNEGSPPETGTARMPGTL